MSLFSVITITGVGTLPVILQQLTLIIVYLFGSQGSLNPKYKAEAKLSNKM